MANLPITPHRDANPIITGHFDMFEDYYAYRPAGTRDYLLIYTVAGLGRFGAPDGREQVFRPHDLLLVHPDTYQDYGVESSLQHWELIWTHFRPKSDWLDLLDWPEVFPGVMRLTVEAPERQQALIEQCDRIDRYAISTGPLNSRLAMHALEGLLLDCAAINPKHSANTFDSRIRATMDHIVRHLGDRITLDDLSEVAGISVSRLGHRFREVVGVPPMEFVERHRIERAKQLLAMTSMSIKEISRYTGYDTQFYFSLRFKKQTGLSPKAYRAKRAASAAERDA